MNWIGGARARAKIKEQFNARANRLGNQQNFAGTTSEDENEEDESGENRDEDAEQGPGQCDNGTVGRRNGGKRKSNTTKTETYTKQTVDYTALGYRLARQSQVQRRVVPLLEFLEKEIPNGQVLSLQLSHLMDITRTPVPKEVSPSRPVSSKSSVTSDSRTVTSTSTSLGHTSPQPGPSNRMDILSIFGESNLCVSSRSDSSSDSNSTAAGRNFKVPAVPPRGPPLHFPLIDDDDSEQDVESSIMIQ